MGDAFLCFRCGADLAEVRRPITRRTHCPDCFAELHSCLMCKKYTTDFHTHCTDDRSDPPERKDSANFCSWFSPRYGAFDDRGKSQADAARGKLGSLFSEDQGEDASDAEPDEPARDESLSAAEALFGKDD